MFIQYLHSLTSLILVLSSRNRALKSLSTWLAAILHCTALYVTMPPLRTDACHTTGDLSATHLLLPAGVHLIAICHSCPTCVAICPDSTSRRHTAHYRSSRSERSPRDETRQHIAVTEIKRQFTQHLTVQLKTNKYCYMCFTEIVNLNNPTVPHNFKKLKILPLQSQYILSLLLFVINNRDYFMVNSEIHNINTRTKSNLHQPISNSSTYQKGTYDSGIKVFSSLLTQIKDLSHNRKQFKCSLKNFLYLHSFYMLDEYFSCNKN